MKMIISMGLCLLALTAGGCHKKPTQPPPFNNEPYKEVEYDPCFSPDGNTIAYAMAESIGDSIGIFFIDADGTNKRLFLGSDGVSRLWSKPDWSPDGKWLLLNDVRSAQIFKIRVPEGDSLTQLTLSGRNFFPSWSLDGKRVAFSQSVHEPYAPESTGIWLITSTGEMLKHLGLGYMPDWFNSNDKLAFSGSGATTNSESQIWITDTIGSNRVQITTMNETNRYPKVSPDGLRILFSSQADEEWPKIWVVNSDGSNPTKLTESGANLPCWSPDGSKIVYCNTSVDGRLWIMNSDGSAKRRLTP